MLNFMRFFLNLTLVVSVVLAVTYSIGWVLGDDGNESKVALFAAIAALATAFLKILNKVQSGAWKEESGENSHVIVSAKIDANGLYAMIKRYDRNIYRVKTIYSLIFTIILTAFVGWKLAEFNAVVLENYDRYKKGEVTQSDPNNIWGFTSFNHESREELEVERNQMMLILLAGLVLLMWFAVRPYIVEVLCKSLYKKTKHVSDCRDFKELSEKMNENLRNYEFLNDEVVKVIINNFTRITKEFYIPSLIK